MPKLAFNDNSNLMTLATLQLPDLSWVNAFSNQITEVASAVHRMHMAMIEPALQMQKAMDVWSGILEVLHTQLFLPTSIFESEIEIVEKPKDKRNSLPIVFQYDHVVVAGKNIYCKMNARHVLAIRALFETSDEFGICLEDEIEKYLRNHGCPPMEGRGMRERIRIAIRDGMRFLELDKLFPGKDQFVKRIRGKGYLLIVLQDNK